MPASARFGRRAKLAGLHQRRLGGLQIVQQFRAGLIALERVLAEAAIDHVLHFQRNTFHGGRRFVDDGHEGGRHVVVLKGIGAGEGFHQGHAQRPDVTALIGSFAGGLLRRNVGQRAGCAVGQGGGGFVHVRQAEVNNLHRALAGKHHVGRLHVAVHDVVGVRLGQSLRHLDADLYHFQNTERLGAGVDAMRQRLALIERHHDEGAAVGRFLDAVNDADVGMIERRGDARFLQEAAFLEVAGVDSGRKKLERNRAFQLEVARLVNHAHGAGADTINDLVIGSDQLANRQRASGCGHFHHPVWNWRKSDATGAWRRFGKR